jgi:putative ABC transport system substrate-binding protein
MSRLTSASSGPTPSSPISIDVMSRIGLILGFVGALGLASVTVPSDAVAQRPALARTVGYLGNSDVRSAAREVDAFRQGLRELGWVEGKTVQIEYRWAESDVDRLPGLVADLVRLKVDVLLVSGVPALRAARDAASTVPIVVGALLLDPVRAGFVKSLARPGGNITGITSQYEDIVTKQVQLLTEAVPKLSRLVLLRHTSAPLTTADAARAAAKKLGLKVRTLEVSDDSEYEAAFRAARSAGAQAVHVLPSPVFNADRRQLIALAAHFRLPAMYEFRAYVEDGGLLSYGVDLPAMFRRAASHVDRIFRGAKAGDLPLERATAFELVINLKTAKALGLTLPTSVLLRADEVIQ